MRSGAPLETFPAFDVVSASGKHCFRGVSLCFGVGAAADTAALEQPTRSPRYGLGIVQAAGWLVIT